MHSKDYREDIDGIRAVAVLLVVLYHVGFSQIPGGYIGVDVFFVISGFLITSLILKKIDKGNFSYLEFYSRRVRRLMPTLFVVLFFTSLLSVVILLPADLVSYSKSLIAVIASLSNIYFWRENGGYFEGGADEVPLIHTWSLSVEEQFYFIWPVFLILSYRYLKPKWIKLLTLVSFIVLLALSEWVTRITYGAAYYLLPTRMFELLIGAILAINWQTLPKLNTTLNHIFSIVGLGLIMWTALFFDKNTSFPGVNASYATIGTAFLIYTGRSKEPGIVNKLLKLPPFVFVGAISYSLYLWHWPLVVFARYTGMEFTFLLSIAILFLSILFSFLSWKYVEQKFRFKKDVTIKQTFKNWYFIPAGLVILFTLIIVKLDGLSFRYSDRIVAMQSALTTQPAKLRKGCHSPGRDYLLPAKPSCRLGNKIKSEASILLIGDSHANHFTGFIDELALQSEYAVQDYTLDSCLPLVDMYWGDKKHFAAICKKRNDLVKIHISKNKFESVILAGNWPSIKKFGHLKIAGKRVSNANNFSDALTLAFTQTIKHIEKSGAIAIIIKDVPPAKTGSPKCPITKILYVETLQCGLTTKQAIKQSEFIEEVFDKVKKQFPKTIFIEPTKVLCDDKNCHVLVNDLPIYLDKKHLNDIGSRELAKLYIAKLNNPLKRSLIKNR